jgi:hypothetical protein
MSFTCPVSAFCQWPAKVLLAVLWNSPGWEWMSNENVSFRKSCVRAGGVVGAGAGGALEQAAATADTAVPARKQRRLSLLITFRCELG